MNNINKLYLTLGLYKTYDIAYYFCRNIDTPEEAKEYYNLVSKNEKYKDAFNISLFLLLSIKPHLLDTYDELNLDIYKPLEYVFNYSEKLFSENPSLKDFLDEIDYRSYIDMSGSSFRDRLLNNLSKNMKLFNITYEYLKESKLVDGLNHLTKVIFYKSFIEREEELKKSNFAQVFDYDDYMKYIFELNNKNIIFNALKNYINSVDKTNIERIKDEDLRMLVKIVSNSDRSYILETSYRNVVYSKNKEFKHKLSSIIIDEVLESENKALIEEFRKSLRTYGLESEAKKLVLKK